LHEVLNTQLEQAKIMEAKDMPTISVLDWAVPPTNKFKPKRIYIVVTAMILSFVFSVVYAVVHDRWRDYKISNPERYKDISVIFSTLKKDLFGFKRRKS
jgi:capsular polysaccharide biosynthesis protein